MNHIDPFERRRSGVLLHPTSLPNKGYCGDIGTEARNFVDFLAAAGQTVWQMLPLGPTHDNRSPYQCLSIYAGNPLLISLEQLQLEGWLSERDVESVAAETLANKIELLQCASRAFLDGADGRDRVAYDDFCVEQQVWLEDYVLYQALREENSHVEWSQWEQSLRDGYPDALAEARQRLSGAMDEQRVEQFFFYRQWMALKDYANQHGVLLFGDMPIFVAYDSADVWRGRRYFDLDKQGLPRVVAGVPPDYFSETGQRWGNPHYRWSKIESEDFLWWRHRISWQLELFDLVRIDHFRGFESCWEIPVEHEHAIEGRWIDVPGDRLFAALRQQYGKLPLVAEDLGIITPEVEALRDKYELPGMKILQFAFDGSVNNPYLPHNHNANSVVYTGTHDNDTTLGWYQTLPDESKTYLSEYLTDNLVDGDADVAWVLIRCALASVSRLAILPMQDILSLGGEHRMNVPGTAEGNWGWRFNWDQLEENTPQRLHDLTSRYARLVNSSA